MAAKHNNRVSNFNQKFLRSLYICEESNLLCLMSDVILEENNYKPARSHRLLIQSYAYLKISNELLDAYRQKMEKFNYRNTKYDQNKIIKNYKLIKTNYLQILCNSKNTFGHTQSFEISGKKVSVKIK